jgi:hypothetical protein
MATPLTMTSDQWLQQPAYQHITVLDPDGWDRLNYEFSFLQELITEAEFKQRLSISTCLFRRAA